MLETISHKLGTEPYEVWTTSTGKRYYLSKRGLMTEIEGDAENYGEVEATQEEYRLLITGKLKPLKLPEHGEWVYVPDITSVGNNKYMEYQFIPEKCNREFWAHLFYHNLVYKTPKEAVQRAEKILELLEE